MRLFGRLFTRNAPPVLPTGISVLREGGSPALVVRYVDHPEWDTQAFTDDPWHRHRTALLHLAFRATADSTWVPPRVDGSPTVVGDEVYVTYECRVRPTAANVTALLASGLEWTAEAAELARGAAVPTEAVEAAREAMRQFAREEVAEFRRLLGQADASGRRPEGAGGVAPPPA